MDNKKTIEKINGRIKFLKEAIEFSIWASPSEAEKVKVMKGAVENELEFLDELLKCYN